MQRVLLLRHSYAQPPGTTSDRERQLTLLGVQRARTVMAGILARGYHPSLGLTSPYRRALQTMALMVEACGKEGQSLDVQAWLGCCSDQDPTEGMAYLTALEGYDTVAVIGHEPFLGALVKQATLMEMEFQECDLAVLCWDRKQWRLEARLSYSDFLT